MSFFQLAVLVASLLTASSHAAGVTGSPAGFASGTTGGGSAVAAAPSDIAELKLWLSDAEARVILIDKEFDFTGSGGMCTDCECCIPTSNACGSAGQNAIVNSLTWCDPYPKTTCTYDKTGQSGLEVASNKSIVGVGDGAVIRGQGLRFVNGNTNIIVQNVHITDINPQYIWGGDAIYMDDTDLIWLDHVKISLVGRQMISMGFNSNGRVTISNTEFDGQTSWSASCDGHHYWTILGLGLNDKVSFYNNWLHHTSGRSPDIGYPSTWHFFNNYWSNNTGHAFSVTADSSVLVEGNVFDDVKTTMEGEPAGVFVVNSTTSSACSTTLGRTCYENIVLNSGSLTPQSMANQTTLDALVSAKEPAVAISAATDVASYVVANAGIGKLGSSEQASGTSSVSPSASPTSSFTTSSATTLATKAAKTTSTFTSSATTLATKASKTSSLSMVTQVTSASTSTQTAAATATAAAEDDECEA
ncbi:putative pectin lyase F [Coleophoma cylindrospora]|uniref:pectin lyase n=1 Tax=Coleophoma cylindrospora TaxID=1849047 RepID=A0A3D8S7I1_9HELO|nr:putative pectin lyase F [Coleophoma cylindrospora]